jgi:hypothetical protein
MKKLHWLVLIANMAAMQACKHPLAIQGQGDIVELNGTGRGCTLEQFEAGNSKCAENEVTGEYNVNYKAEPRPGWRFVRWEGPCAPRSDFQHCRFEVSKEGVAWWDENYADVEIPPSRAIFQAITGETGYLVAGTPVAGVTYKTATQNGVTGLDGSFQYEQGETVRFMIGDTLLGDALGQAQVTTFDLAGAPTVTGINVLWSLDKHTSPFPDESFDWDLDDHLYPDPRPEERFFYQPNPFHRVINTTILLKSLDEDANPDNGIVIKPGVADLFHKVRLDLDLEWERFLGAPESSERPADIFTLRYQVGRANNKGLFSIPHGVAKPAVAMQSLYETLGLDSRTYALCPAYDEGPPGRTDCRFDDNGNLVWVDSGREYVYDSDGNLLRAEDPWEIEIYKYNLLGNKVEYTRYRKGEENPEKIESWTYDSYGNVTRFEEDHGADGKIEVVQKWRYDSKGRPAWSMLGEDRENDDWEEMTWTYHENNTLKRYQKIRSNADEGRGKWTYKWLYDTRGRPVRYSEEISSSNGYRIQVETWKYDNQGSVTRKLYFSEEQDRQLLPVSTQYYQFDADGYLIEYAPLEESTGTKVALDRWQYDDQGKMRLFERTRYNEFVAISSNNSPGYPGGELYSNEGQQPDPVTEDIAFVTFVIPADSPDTGKSVRDQGQIFNTDATGGGSFVYITTDTKSQSITTGVSGQLAGIRMQWLYAIPTPSPTLNFTVVSGGNPLSGDILYSEEVDLSDISLGTVGLFEWDLKDANLYFEQGDQFCFTFSALNEGPQYTNIKREQFDYDATGKITRREVYDESGRLAGTRTWQYNSRQLLTRYEEDENADGMPESIQTWNYDSLDELIRRELDRGDGEILFDRWIYGQGSELRRHEWNYGWSAEPGVRSEEYQTTGWGHLF